MELTPLSEDRAQQAKDRLREIFVINLNTVLKLRRVRIGAVLSAAGMSRTSFSRVMNFKESPTLDRIARISAVLHCRPSDLLGPVPTNRYSGWIGGGSDRRVRLSNAGPREEEVEAVAPTRVSRRKRGTRRRAKAPKRR